MKRIALISLTVALLSLCISLLPADGQASGLRLTAATRTTVEQYLKQDERIYPVAKILLDSGGWVEIVSLVPTTMKDLAVHDVLADRYDTIVSRNKYLVPIIPIRNDGRLDLDNLELRINQTSLVARINPIIIAATSPCRLSAEEGKKIEQLYQTFYQYHLVNGYHIYEDAQLGYNDALEGILTNSSLGYYGSQKDFLPKLLLVTEKTVASFWQTDRLVAAKANDIWNRAYNIARQTAASDAEALELADQSSRFYDRIWAIQAKHQRLGTAIGIGLSQGGAVLERVLGAMMPVIFFDGADRDLANIRTSLPDTKEGRLLRNAIDRLLPRIRGEVDTFSDKLIQSLKSGEFQVDMTMPVLTFLRDVLLKKAATKWGIPIIGKAFAAMDVGFFLGDVLSNNQAISKEIESAKYAMDIEAVLHQVAYGYLYRTLQGQIQRGEVNNKDIEAFESAVYLTFLSESYYWQKLATGFNSTTQVKDAFDSFVRGTTGPKVAKNLIPLAKQSASTAEKWRKPTVVKDLVRVTLERLQAQGRSLNENIIRRLFQSRFKRADGPYYNYDIDYITWQEGAFTKKGVQEALVSFMDNTCMACEPGELWLLQYRDDWNIMIKIAESHDTSFRTIDIDKDGILEILVEGSALGQGVNFLQYEVVSLSHGTRSRLYYSECLDSTSAGYEGEALCSHKIEFKDIDNDNILELIDVFERASYRWSGEKWKSEYIQTSRSVEKIAYKLRQGKFIRTSFRP